MLNLTGTLVNVFQPSSRDGEKPKPKAQIMGDIALPDGAIRKDLITVSIKDQSSYSDLQTKIGEQVSISVGAFAPAKGSVLFFGV